MYIYQNRDIPVVTHVNDFLVSAEPRHATWFRDEMARKYKLKVNVIGWEPGGKWDIEFSGRMTRTTSSGVEFEGGRKHAEKLVVR